MGRWKPFQGKKTTAKAQDAEFYRRCCLTLIAFIEQTVPCYPAAASGMEQIAESLENDEPTPETRLLLAGILRQTATELRQGYAICIETLEDITASLDAGERIN